MIQKSTVKLIILLVMATLVVFFTRKVIIEKFPGNYPMITPSLEFKTAFYKDRVEFTLPKATKSGRIIIYAYNIEGGYFGILKPIYNNTVKVYRNDFADFSINIEWNKITDVIFLKQMDRYIKRVNMFDLLELGRSKHLRHGVQACLYPICTKCTDGCKSVLPNGDLPIKMMVMKNGQIMPVFFRGKCPRCGKCFIWCPSEVIKKGKKPWEM